MEVMNSHPTSEELFLAFGGFFVIFGVFIVGFQLKSLYDLTKDEKASDTIIEEIEFPEEIFEPYERSERQVQMVKVGADSQEESEHIEASSEEEEYEEMEDELPLEEEDDAFSKLEKI